MSFSVTGKPSIVFSKTVSDCDKKDIKFIFYILPSKAEHLHKLFAVKVRNQSLNYNNNYYYYCCIFALIVSIFETEHFSY